MRRTVEVARSGPRPTIRLRRVPACEPPYDDERDHPFWPDPDQLTLDWPLAVPAESQAGVGSDAGAGEGSEGGVEGFTRAGTGRGEAQGRGPIGDAGGSIEGRAPGPIGNA